MFNTSFITRHGGPLDGLGGFEQRRIGTLFLSIL